MIKLIGMGYRDDRYYNYGKISGGRFGAPYTGCEVSGNMLLPGADPVLWEGGRRPVGTRLSHVRSHHKVTCSLFTVLHHCLHSTSRFSDYDTYLCVNNMRASFIVGFVHGLNNR